MSEADDSFRVPDLISLCGETFHLRANRHCRAIADATLQWAHTQGLVNVDNDIPVEKLQLPLLASLQFPACDFPQLKAITDFQLHAMVGELEPGPAFDDIWLRLQRGTSLQWQSSFQDLLGKVRSAPTPATFSLASVSGMSTFVALRREMSPFSLSFAFIEYAKDLDVSQAMKQYPTLCLIAQCAKDIVMWMQDVASYNIQQAQDDEHNLIVALMHFQMLSLQPAMDEAGQAIKKLLDTFLTLERRLLESEAKSDPTVQEYVQGIRDWVIGFAHWVYETDLFFQDNKEEVKEFGWVFVLAKGIDPIQTWVSQAKSSSVQTV